VDGALYEMAPPPKHLALPVISRIKVMSNLNIAERRLPQDGRIQLIWPAGRWTCASQLCRRSMANRSCCACSNRTVVNLALENLGMPDEILEKAQRVDSRPQWHHHCHRPDGLRQDHHTLFVPQTRQYCGHQVAHCEDPVEYDIEGIMQVPVNEGIGMTFARALRAFLRQDPDIIMVGEMRDLETAQISIQASLTGHLVFTTLHTNDAPGAVRA